MIKTHTTKAAENRDAILNVLSHIATDELDNETTNLVHADYNNQRTLISSLFNNDEYNKGQVILRLTVIDSLYSTNAAYSYFSFEEMSERILSLGSREMAQSYFYEIACLGKDKERLFDEPYGIQKDLKEGSKQMSLLSKYAYYEVLQKRERYPLGFPIYDRLAKRAYAVVCKLVELKPLARMNEQSSPAIETYVSCLNQLRHALFDDNSLFMGRYQQFDILDAYLWRMGKFDDGNLSLLLGRDDYVRFIRNIGLDFESGKSRSNDFNVLVRTSLTNDERPFRGCSNEAYMEILRENWLRYASYERAK